MYRQVWWYLSLVFIAGALTSFCYHQMRDDVALLRALESSARSDESVEVRLLAQRIERLQQNNSYVLRGVAKVYSLRGEHHDAARVLARVALISPGDRPLLAELMRELDAAKRPAEALAVYDGHADLFASDVEAKFHAANLSVQIEDFGRAEQLYHALLGPMPASRTVRTKLAQVLFWQQRWDEAVGELDELLKTSPDAMLLLLMRARALGWAKRYEEAASAYLDLVKRAGLPRTKEAGDPTIQELEWELGEVYFGAKAWSDAAQHYRTVLEQEPSNARARGRLIEALYYGREYQAAALELSQIPDTQRTVQQDKLLAEILIAAGDHVRAREALEQYLVRVPEDDESHVLLADVHTWLKQYAAAKEEYRRILLRRPGDDQVRKKYIQVLLWSREPVEAAAELKKLRGDHGHSP